VLTPRSVLLRAIFGEKAEDVRDASLIVRRADRRDRGGRQGPVRKGVEKDERAKSIEGRRGARARKDFETRFRSSRRRLGQARFPPPAGLEGAVVVGKVRESSVWAGAS